MIDCKHFENIDITPWHGDAFDHPSYQSFCHLKNKNIHRYWCTQCENYIPDCENASDFDIECELRWIKEKLETDDRANPMPGSLVSKLIKLNKHLTEEVTRRKHVTKILKE